MMNMDEMHIKTLRPSEQIAAMALQRYFREVGTETKCTPGSDPPDLECLVEGSNYAVEVTELHRYVWRPNSKPISERSLLVPFSQGITRQATQSGTDPEQPGEVIAVRLETDENAVERALGELNPGDLPLFQVDPNALGGDGQHRFGDIANTHRFAIHDRVSRKAHKLREVRGFAGKVLLVCCLGPDWPFMPDTRSLRNYCEEIPTASSEFSAIFMVYDHAQDDVRAHHIAGAFGTSFRD